MKKILITGATGFVGNYLLKELVKKKNNSKSDYCYNIRILAKRKDHPDFKRNLEKVKSLEPKVEIIYGDLREKQSVIKAVKGIDIIIHLAAVIRSINRKEFYDVNVQGTKNLIEACKINKVKRIIITSTIAAYRKCKGDYGKTKKIADQLFLNASLALTILIPPLIYGKESQGLKKIIKYINKFPFLIPIIGKGKFLQQPAYVEDTVEAIISCLENDDSIGKSYWVGGKEAITFNKLIDSICENKGIKKKIKIHLPVFICNGIATILETMGLNIITKREIRSLNEDGIVSNEKAIKEINYNPVDFEEGIRKTFLK